MTTFKHSLRLCGLSQTQAAEFFGVSLQTVKHWTSNRNNPPKGVWIMLAELFSEIEDAADFAAEHMLVEGIDPRAWGHIEADCGPEPLPEFATQSAGAMALLLAVNSLKS